MDAALAGKSFTGAAECVAAQGLAD